MGKSMSATPTPVSMVWQGGANTLENRCHTTPPLKGGRGWWGVHHLFGVGWGSDLVPMPPCERWGVDAVGGVLLSLPKKFGEVC